MVFGRMVAVVLSLFLLGCASNPVGRQADECRAGLRQAYDELDFAKAKGFSGTVEYTKAAALLGAAKIQEEFGKYPNCIDKVERARGFIKLSLEPK